MLDWLLNGEFPYWSAIILGLVVSVCPCTIAANVSALTCMLKQNRHSFTSLSLVYIVARSLTYSAVGVLLTYFVGEISLTADALSWIGKIIGPLFVLIGLFMLDLFHIHGLENKCVLWMNRVFNESYSLWSAFLLGILLAFAFCPYSAATYFGMMLPMACVTTWGWLIPILFSLGAALPLAFIAWVLYKGIESKIDMWNRFHKFEYWFRKILAIVFIITGLLFIWEFFIE